MTAGWSFYWRGESRKQQQQRHLGIRGWSRWRFRGRPGDGEMPLGPPRSHVPARCCPRAGAAVRPCAARCLRLLPPACVPRPRGVVLRFASRARHHRGSPRSVSSHLTSGRSLLGTGGVVDCIASTTTTTNNVHDDCKYLLQERERKGWRGWSNAYSCGRARRHQSLWLGTRRGLIVIRDWPGAPERR